MTIQIIPDGTELLVFYGAEFGSLLNVDLNNYNQNEHFTDGQETSITDTNENEIYAEIPYTSDINTNVGTEFHQQEQEITNDDIATSQACELEEYYSLRNQEENIHTIQPTSNEGENIIIISGLDNPENSSVNDNSEETFLEASDTVDEARQNSENQVLKPIYYVPEPSKMYICDICEFMSTYRSNIKRHKNTVHKQLDYKFECDVCLKQFPIQSKLNLHKVIHTGKKKFKCRICLYSTNYGKRFDIHLSHHRTESEEKCDVCTYSASTKTNLFQHMKYHH